MGRPKQERPQGALGCMQSRMGGSGGNSLCCLPKVVPETSILDIIGRIRTIFGHIRTIFVPYSDHTDHIPTIWIIIVPYRPYSDIFGSYFGWAVHNAHGDHGRAQSARRPNNAFFAVLATSKKSRSIRTIFSPAVSHRDLCYASENEDFCSLNFGSTCDAG